MSKRDTNYLRWRFCSHAVHPYYRTFYLLDGYAPVGYVVLARETCEGLDSIVIVDYLCEPRLAMTLFSLCLRKAYELDATAVWLTTAASSLWPRLAVLGFFKRRSGKRLMAKFTGVDRSTCRVMTDFRNWFLTASDSDAHRPKTLKPCHRVIG